MTSDKYDSKWQIGHCYPLSNTNLSYNTDMNKTTNWINLRSMCSSENISNGFKVNHHLYLLQQIKAIFFIKINEEKLSQDFW